MRIVPSFDIRLDMIVFLFLFCRYPRSSDPSLQEDWMVQQRQRCFAKALLGLRQGGRRCPCRQER